MKIETPEDFINRLFICLTHQPCMQRENPLCECTIDLAFLIDLFKRQDGRCAITNVPMMTHYGMEAICIDRIDYDKGYIPDNVHLVCQWTTHARNHESLIAFKSVLSHFLIAHHGDTVVVDGRNMNPGCVYDN
jgi:hypothetical protein